MYFISLVTIIFILSTETENANVFENTTERLTYESMKRKIIYGLCSTRLAMTRKSKKQRTLTSLFSWCPTFKSCASNFDCVFLTTDLIGCSKNETTAGILALTSSSNQASKSLRSASLCGSLDHSSSYTSGMQMRYKLQIIFFQVC